MKLVRRDAIQPVEFCIPVGSEAVTRLRKVVLKNECANQRSVPSSVVPDVTMLLYQGVASVHYCLARRLQIWSMPRRAV